MANVDTWMTFLFDVEKPLGLHSNPGTHQYHSSRYGSCMC